MHRAMSDEKIDDRRLSHRRFASAVYFVTWRLVRDAEQLSAAERDVMGAALRHFNRQRYALLAYVVMNDHVHVLVQPHDGFTLQDIVRAWKRYTGRRLVRSGRHAAVWQEESVDQLMRGRAEISEKLHDIASSPSKRWPGLTSYPWLWVDRDALA
jgi:REP element-mobilizing transposase RayT